VCVCFVCVCVCTVVYVLPSQTRPLRPPSLAPFAQSTFEKLNAWRAHPLLGARTFNQVMPGFTLGLGAFVAYSAAEFMVEQGKKQSGGGDAKGGH